jgi:hypothetical protein
MPEKQIQAETPVRDYTSELAEGLVEILNTRVISY